MKIERLNSEEVAYICTQMNTILESGVPLQDGLEVLIEDINNKSAKSIIEFIINEIEEKKALYVILEECGVFPNYMIKMVKIGEMTGKLDEVFKLLADYYTNENDMIQSIKNAIFQPVLLLTMMFFVVAVLVIKIIPAFADIFNKLNIQVSSDFNKTMDFAVTTGLTVLITISVIIGILLIGMLVIGTKRGKEAFKFIIDRCFLTKDISQKISLSRFSFAMTLMIKSGVDTTESLEYVQDVIISRKIKRKISKCYEDVLDNKGFVESIINEKIFPSMCNQMLKVSYKSGAYEKAWEKISKQYEKDVNESLSNIIQSIEPFMVTIMTIVIGAILISVMLPLMGIMTSIG